MTDTTTVEKVTSTPTPSKNNPVPSATSGDRFGHLASIGPANDMLNDGKQLKRAATEEDSTAKETKSRRTSAGAQHLQIKQDLAIKDNSKPCLSDDSAQETSGDTNSEAGPRQESESSATLLNNNPLSLLTQQQQLLQYAQASGQDLANLTASSLAQAMVSPMAVPGLNSNLLQQLHNGNVITSLPGPPPQMSNPAAGMGGADSLTDDGQGGKRNVSVRNMSNDERRQRRLLRNRVAAKECRKKKKQYIQDMEEQIAHLKEENARLHKEIEELHTKFALGTMQGSESYRLMKEVEELNAKLGMGNLPASSNALAAAVMAAVQQHQQQLHPPHPLSHSQAAEQASQDSQQSQSHEPPSRSSSNPSSVPTSSTSASSHPDTENDK